MRHSSITAEVKIKFQAIKHERDGKPKPCELSLADFCTRLGKFTTLPVTQEEYWKLDKTARAALKGGVGGFTGPCSPVAGKTNRRAGNAERWNVLCWDLDKLSKQDFARLRTGVHPLCDYEWFAYTTASHTPDKPRLRIVVFLDRPIDADLRGIAGRLLIGDLSYAADKASFNTVQVMYWPTTCKDRPGLSWHNHGALYRAWEAYCNWKADGECYEELPRAAGEEPPRKPGESKLGDPRDKRGYIGAFCRQFADMEEFLIECMGEVYSPSNTPSEKPRFTFASGESADGLVCYGQWAYSHHTGHDPAADGRCKNAYDLIWIHFCDRDHESTRQWIKEYYPEAAEEAEAELLDGIEVETDDESDENDLDPYPVIHFKSVDPATLDWPEPVLDGLLYRKSLTVTVAAPKVGKTLLALAEAVDMATGGKLGLYGGEEYDPRRVLYYCAEDSAAILQGRAIGVLKTFDVDDPENLFLLSGLDKNIRLMTQGRNGGVLDEKSFKKLERQIVARRIDVLVLDPLQNLNEAEETNVNFLVLGKRLLELAKETNIAIHVIHHTRKPAQGEVLSMYSGRGGSSLPGVARIFRTLGPLTDKEAKDLGIDKPWRYFGVTSIDANHVNTESQRDKWFEKIGHDFETCGESVPVPKPWSKRPGEEDYALLTAVQDKLPLRVNRRAEEWIGHVIKEVRPEADVDATVSRWLAAGYIREQQLPDALRKKRPHYVIGKKYDPCPDLPDESDEE